MKQCLRWSISVTAFLALLALSALAQDQADNAKLKIAAEAQAKIEIAKTMGTQFSFETKVVKGAPYSATAEAETIQTLTDGNRIRNKTTTTVYRDSEGRTRREVAGKTPGVAAEVFISDPVNGVNYALNPQQRTAVKSQPNLQLKLIAEKKQLAEQEVKPRTVEGERPVTINVNGRAVPWEQLNDEERMAAEKKMRAEKEMQDELKAAPVGGVMLKKRPGTTESLGQQMVEGVLCEGKRTTITIPANSIGNDLPLNIVMEEWYSPELQVLVLTKHSDPRNGETSYRLTNLNRSEPARALFEVPADYRLKDSAPLPMKKRLPEEQQ